MPTVNFRLLFDLSPNPYMLLDRELRYVAANPAYVRATGTSLDDLIGRYIFDAFPNDPDDPTNESAVLLRESLRRVISTGQADVIALIPYRVPKIVDGATVLEDRFWSATHTPVLDDEGQVAFILQHTVDVTELNHPAAPDRTVAEQAQLQAGLLSRARQVQEVNTLLEREHAAGAKAEASEAAQRFLAESIPQQVWTATPDGHLDFVNNRVAEYFNAPRADFLGRGWERVIHPDDLPLCVERWSHSLATGDEYDVEFRLRAADGTYRWHIGRALALRDGEGRIVKWFGTNTDVDEVRRARDELQSRAEYEQQIIGIVSHDLRNPLNVIAMAGSLLLQRGRLDDQQGQTVARIVSSTERAVRLIRDFLDFTQARSTGRMPVYPAEANIRELARQVFDDVHLMYPDREATISHEGEETGVWDPNRLLQLLTNLIGNAFQHSPAGGSVSVMTRGSAAEAVLEVRNDGDPIPTEYLPRLFEPFERGTSTKTSSDRSIGLGLFISKQIVLAHSGRIDVRSTAGEGTTFTVTLPRRMV